MAVTGTVMKLTHQEAVVKVAGTAATHTIDLSVALVPASGQILDGETQTVTITGVTWSGADGGVVTISRGGVTVMTLQANAAGMLLFDGQTMPPESIGATADISVAISGAQAECWLKLRKVSGYKTTIEPEQFGPYDNPAVAGS